jgi:hypothetical protein
MSMKISNDTIENRTRDLPACNEVPQPTAPQRASAWLKRKSINVFFKRQTNLFRITDLQSVP